MDSSVKFNVKLDSKLQLICQLSATAAVFQPITENNISATDAITWRCEKVRTEKRLLHRTGFNRMRSWTETEKWWVFTTTTKMRHV